MLGSLQASLRSGQAFHLGRWLFPDPSAFGTRSSFSSNAVCPLIMIGSARQLEEALRGVLDCDGQWNLPTRYQNVGMWGHEGRAGMGF